MSCTLVAAHSLTHAISWPMTTSRTSPLEPGSTCPRLLVNLSWIRTECYHLPPWCRTESLKLSWTARQGRSFDLLLMCHVKLLLSLVVEAGLTPSSHRFMQGGFSDFFRPYTRQGESRWKFPYGYCVDFTPDYRRPMTESWRTTGGGFRYSGNSIVAGGASPKWKPFWLWFWKKKRTQGYNMLLLKDFNCQMPFIRAEICGTGAGIAFRVRGTYDYWALLNGGGSVVIQRVVEGKKSSLFGVPGAGSCAFIALEDQMGDLVIWVAPPGQYGRARKYKRKGSMSEMDPQLGTAGLIAYSGATFKNVVFGDVPYVPSYDFDMDVGDNTVNLNKAELESWDIQKWVARALPTLEQWCPPGSFCRKTIGRLLPLNDTYHLWGADTRVE